MAAMIGSRMRTEIRRATDECIRTLRPAVESAVEEIRMEMAKVGYDISDALDGIEIVISIDSNGLHYYIRHVE